MSKKKKGEGGFAVEEKYEEVRQLVALGRERGFLSYDEINEMLPDEISSSPRRSKRSFSLMEAYGSRWSTRTPRSSSRGRKRHRSR